jgi:hypothetical protein
MNDHATPPGPEPTDRDGTTPPGFDALAEGFAAGFTDAELDDVTAVVDGGADDDQRTRVESDERLSALARELGVLRVELRATPPLSAERRERAIHAALDAFDDLIGGAPVTPNDDTNPASPVVELAARRRRARRWLDVAAAVVTVTAVGGLAAFLAGRDGSDGGVAESPEIVAVEPATGGTDAKDVAASDVRVGGGADGGLPPVGGAVASAEAAPEAAPDETAAAGLSIDGPAEVMLAVPEFTTPDAVRTWAAGIDDVLPLPGQLLACVPDGGTYVGDVRYQGVDAVVVRDAGSNLIVAARAGCEVLVTAE